jgi:glycosyltransferase involved in cell wall biosynthesis
MDVGEFARAPSAPSAGGNPALVLSTVFPAADLPARIGQESYSYHFVQRAFSPLLKRWAHTTEVDRPESRLDFALRRARQQGFSPVHLSFLPLHETYLSALAPNLAFPFWEFPDLPDGEASNNPRHNWARIANCLDLILVASSATRQAFRRAGVQTPVHLVPVPVAAECFDVADWSPGRRDVLECPCYLFPQPTPARAPVDPLAAPSPQSSGLLPRLRRGYKEAIRPRLPALLDRAITLSSKCVVGPGDPADVAVPYPKQSRLELSGVVYTTIFNPFDPRKNWIDLLSAFLLALRDCEDATLVVKLAVSPRLANLAARGFLDRYQGMGISHRCKLAVVTDYLPDTMMWQLTQGSTYYLQATHAEGACLPLQEFLAAGRPGVGPVHTAMADYFDETVGFAVASNPEPAAWPLDPSGRLTTTWHRIVWQSLHDQIQASYQLAREQSGAYQELARNGRQRIADFAGADQVWPRLVDALSSLPAGRATPLRRPAITSVLAAGTR